MRMRFLEPQLCNYYASDTSFWIPFRVTLGPNDDFLVLGCDGIFDCLTNEQCVEYVRSRINTKTLTEIGIEMLNDIISDDPR
jgi:serine/threonine protein phosphatase PrpC